jgi:hypothetical protein
MREARRARRESEARKRSTTRTGAKKPPKYEQVQLEFLSNEEVDVCTGTILLRGREMIIDLPPQHGWQGACETKRETA